MNFFHYFIRPELLHLKKIRANANERDRMRAFHRLPRLLLIPAVMLLLSACGSTKKISAWFQPDDKTEISKMRGNDRWDSYEEIISAFAEIKPGETTVADLNELNLGPESKNVEEVFYFRLEALIRGNVPDNSISKLPDSVIACLQEQDRCKGLIIKGDGTFNVSTANIFERMMGKKDTVRKGWIFTAVIAYLADDTDGGGTVVYAKPMNTIPHVEELPKEKDPFGIFDALPSPFSLF